MKVSLDSCLRRNDNGDDNEGVDRRLDTGLRRYGCGAGGLRLRLNPPLHYFCFFRTGENCQSGQYLTRRESYVNLCFIHCFEVKSVSINGFEYRTFMFTGRTRCAPGG
jgi:hypothetical protein